jgi:hypothetical protein
VSGYVERDDTATDATHSGLTGKKVVAQGITEVVGGNVFVESIVLNRVDIDSIRDRQAGSAAPKRDRKHECETRPGNVYGSCIHLDFKNS